MTHSFYVVMGGFALHDPQENIHRPIHPQVFVKRLSDGEFVFPELPEAEILDKSKGDGLAKMLAVFKMLWFSTQLVGRLVRGWAATELEVLTFSTCLVILVIYTFWWNKPFDVRCQTLLTPNTGKTEVLEVLPVVEVHVTDQSVGTFPPKFYIERTHFSTAGPPQPKQTASASDPNPRHKFHQKIFPQSPSSIFKVVIGFPFYFIWDMVGNSDVPGCWVDCGHPVSPPDMPGVTDSFNLLVIFISCTFFGGLHFITWSFDMPSILELWLWRGASIVLTAIPCLLTIILVIGYMFQPSPHFSMVTMGVSYFLFALHPAIRFIIIIDSVCLLRDLPDTAFLAV